MRIISAKLYLILSLLSCFAYPLYGQLSKVHYIPPIVVSQIDNSLPRDQYMYISTPSESEVTYVIKPIGQPSTAYHFGSVSNTNPVEFGNSYPGILSQTNDTPFVIPENLTSSPINDRGYIIEAEKPVYVSVRFQSQAQAGRS